MVWYSSVPLHSKIGSSMLTQISNSWETQQVRLSIIIGVSASILCFFFLQLPDAVLEFGLSKGYAELAYQVNTWFHRHFVSSSRVMANGEVADIFQEIISPTTFQALLSLFAGYLTSILFVPALRLARCHHDLLRSHKAPFYT
jgi:hypothetical protein